MTSAEALEAAVALHRAGRQAEAEAAYRHILALDAQHMNAWQLLGLLCYQTGRHDEAAEFIERAIALCGGTLPVLFNNLGAVERARRRLDAARHAYEQALRLQPQYPEALYNLGNLCKEQGQTTTAITCYRQAVQLKPNYGAAHDGLAMLLQMQGDVEGAIRAYHAALQHGGDNARAHCNLASLYLSRNAPEQALEQAQRAIQLRPEYAKAHNNAGTALRALGRICEAEASFRRALEHDPTLHEARNNLATALEGQGRVDEAEEHFELAVEAAPQLWGIHSNRLMCQLYRAPTTLESLATMHAEWNARFAAPLRATWMPHANAPELDKRLRVGLVSGDFGNHPVGCIALPIVERHDPTALEITCYATRWTLDDVQIRLKSAAEHWVDASPWNDAQLAERIRADGIDVLVDLSGHTAHHQLLVFARRPAPVQITWAGYQATTGLEAIDVLLTERTLVPPEWAGHYRERIVYLPESPWCAEIPHREQDPGPLPLLARGAPTFGSFNNPSKLSARVLQTWADILTAVQDARLILKYRGLDDPGLATQIRQRFAARGVDPRRIELRGSSPFPEMLASYREIDVALDPFPFTGGMTSLLALWMGVPVVTVAGQTLASRQTAAMLHTLGETHGLANDLDQYVSTAVSLVQDTATLRALRGSLRERLARSAYVDPGRFVPAWTTAIRREWQAWCATRT